MKDDLTVRQYHPDDYERVLQLHSEPMDEVDAYADDEDELDADLENIEAVYLSEGGNYIVGECDDQIVAMGAYKPPSEYFTHFLGEIDKDTVEITRMRVDSEYQSWGFGERVYDELEHRARVDGHEELLLDTTHRQQAAQGLYEKKGFREIKRQSVELDGDRLTMIFYKKSL